MHARVVWTGILCRDEGCGGIRTEFPYGRVGREGILGAGGATQLGRGRSCVEGGMVFIASFSLRPPFPIQAYTVVTRLALTFTIVAFWSFLSTLYLAVLAGPLRFSNDVVEYLQ